MTVLLAASAVAGVVLVAVVGFVVVKRRKSEVLPQFAVADKASVEF